MFKHKLYMFICVCFVYLYSYCTRQIKQLVFGEGDSSSRSINCIQYVVYCECVCVFESLQPVDVVTYTWTTCWGFVAGPTTHSLCCNRLILI